MMSKEQIEFDKEIRDTEFGKLMENSSRERTCLRCKYIDDDTCLIASSVCMENRKGYFAKDETEENKDGNT